MMNGFEIIIRAPETTENLLGTGLKPLKASVE
jgi:hypothetical protein